MDILEMFTEEEYPTLHKLVNENDARFIVETTYSSNTERTTYKVKLENKVGKRLQAAQSSDSIERCLSNIERSMATRLEEEKIENQPWQNLKNEIDKLNLLENRGYGSEKMGGYRLSLYPESIESNKIVARIGIKNAGNEFITFDPFGDSMMVNVHASWVNHHLTGGSTILKLFEAINNYLYIDKDIRIKELDELLS